MNLQCPVGKQHSIHPSLFNFLPFRFSCIYFRNVNRARVAIALRLFLMDRRNFLKLIKPLEKRLWCQEHIGNMVEMNIGRIK